MLRSSSITTLTAFALIALSSGCGAKQPPNHEQAQQNTQGRPNILLIIADDLGIADLGAFGGEISTHNLDTLAYEGTRFTHFRASPACSPSRAMLMTGVDHHKAGLGNMAEELAPNQQGQPGYEGHLNRRVVTIATLLRDAGYKTYLTGKWHLGLSEETSPAARGFDQSFAMLTGGAHHFDDLKPAYSPDPKGIAPFRNNGKKLSKLPNNYHYSSQFLSDQLIDYIEAGRDGEQRPFFAVLSFMAVHWPLQAPTEAIEQYKGRYNAGYDVIAKQRLARQKQLGIINHNSSIVGPPPRGKQWDALERAQQLREIRAMEIYAAMVTQMDYHSGRVLDYLRDVGLFENTMIVFLSDNGAEGHDFDTTWPKDQFPKIHKVIKERYDFSYENMGKPNSYVLYGPNWARAGAPGYRLHKAFMNEGGLRVAAFMYHPKTIASGTIHRGQFHIKDIAPTILSAAGVPQPTGKHYQGRAVEAMTGIDMLPYIKKTSKTSLPPKRVEVLELLGKRYVLEYPWKLIHQPPPYGKNQWELYHLEQDPGEARDLAALYPNKVKQLNAHWAEYVRENNVILPNWVSGY